MDKTKQEQKEEQELLDQEVQNEAPYDCQRYSGDSTSLYFHGAYCPVADASAEVFGYALQSASFCIGPDGVDAGDSDQLEESSIW